MGCSDRASHEQALASLLSSPILHVTTLFSLERFISPVESRLRSVIRAWRSMSDLESYPTPSSSLVQLLILGAFGIAFSLFRLERCLSFRT